MRTRTFIPIHLLVAIVLAACTPTALDPTFSPSESAGEPTSPASSAPSPTPASSSPEATPVPSASIDAVPSDELGAFTCDLPIVEDPTVAVANIVDVRVGAHAGYDRVVLEFAQGTPELSLSRAEPPFTEDGSGFPVEVEGEHFLALVMRGGSKQTDEGGSSYDGPTNFDPGLPALVDLVEAGDFERQATWVFGLDAEACVRVFLLDDPHRLVIDIEH